MVKNLPAMHETQVQSLGWKNPLEKGMSAHFSILAWRVPWTEKPSRLQSMRLQRVGHDWATLESPLDFKEIQPVHSKRDQSWVFTGRTDVEAETPILWPPHAKSWLIGKRLRCWEGWEARGEGYNRGWDGWMASPTRWTWVWVNSGSWWWTGRPGVLRFMGLQRVGHDWATELNWTVLLTLSLNIVKAPAPFSSYTFSNQLVNVYKMSVWNFYWDFIDSIDNLGRISTNDIDSLYSTQTAYISSFIFISLISQQYFVVFNVDLQHILC